MTGPADAVARLMEALSGMSEVIFGPVLQPARGGDVSCTAQVVTHPSAEPPADGQGVRVTVQSVLEVAPGTLSDPAAAQRVEVSVADAVLGLPGVRSASSRVVSAVALPAARE
ncbi:hypothetical protein ACIHJG_38895 [Streptomyces sp. NPDC052415]|uniref:hypothetical protein n=1 Tax=Streptomyces sp. NPDC052415 TaxID=3365690 RepID=UPI0037D80AB1